MSKEVGRAHLKRVLIVVEQRDQQNGRFVAFDLHHIEGSLKSTGMVDTIDVLYYSEQNNNGEWLINYCNRKKPDAVLLSLQDMMPQREKASPEALGIITHTMNLPTIMFWFSIHANSIAELMGSYSPTLNIIGGADASSHKLVKCGNHIYAQVNFSDALFNIPDGARDIPVGLLGSLVTYRRQWIDGLKEFGIPVFTGGGQLVDGGTTFSTGKAPPLWLPYEEYLGLTSRMKIVLNFTSGTKPMYLPATSPIGQLERGLNRLITQIKGGLSVFIKNPSRLRYAMPALKTVATLSVKKPKDMARARVSEALWCRSFFLEEYNSITERYFEPYVDFVPFTTLNDLVDKIRYYLENDEERDRIRMQGRATMEKYYNAQMYWENIFEAAGVLPNKQFHHHPGEIWDKAHFDNWYLGK